MNVASHNMMALNACRQLNIVSKSRAKSTEKLSSGYRTNRAADDAAGLAISEKMRRQIRGLTQGIANAQDGVSLCQVADGALSEVSDMLHRMTELSVKAANGTYTAQDRQMIQNEMSQIIQEVDRIGDSTSFNERKVFDGSMQIIEMGSRGPYAGTDEEIRNKLIHGNYMQAYQDITYDGTTYKASAINAYLAGMSSYMVNDELRQNGIRYDGPNGAGTQRLAECISVLVQSDELSQKAWHESGRLSDGEYELFKGYLADYKNTAQQIVSESPTRVYSLCTAMQYGAGVTPLMPNMSIARALYGDIGDQVQNLVAGGAVPLISKWGTGGMNNAADLLHLSPDFATAYRGTPARDVVCNQITDDYQKILYLINGYMPDGTVNEEMANQYQGVWIQSGAEAGDGVQIGIDAMNASILGIKGKDVTSTAGSACAIESVKHALKKVSENRSKIGAQQNRLEHTIANESNIVENTTAAESAIRDTDMAREMVKYSKENILEQVGQAMLSQANQSGQGILGLLQG